MSGKMFGSELRGYKDARRGAAYKNPYDEGTDFHTGYKRGWDKGHAAAERAKRWTL